MINTTQQVADSLEQLKHSELFKDVDPVDLQALVRMMERKRFAAGTILFGRDEEGDTMYEIVSGSIRIYTHDAAGNELTLIVRKAGEVVGEMTLIDRRRRSASAIAHEPLEVLELNRDNFLKFLRERPAVGLQMMRTLSGRIRYTTQYLQKVMDWVKRLGEGDFEETLAELQQEAASGGEMQQLIGAFLEMCDSMQSRERQLKNLSDEENWQDAE